MELVVQGSRALHEGDVFRDACELRAGIRGKPESLGEPVREVGDLDPDDGDEPPAEESGRDFLHALLGGRLDRDGVQRALLPENRPVETLQRRARIDPQLLEQDVAAFLVDAQGVRLAP